eukprot:917690-Rhodomonas_salina.1
MTADADSFHGLGQVYGIKWDFSHLDEALQEVGGVRCTDRQCCYAFSIGCAVLRQAMLLRYERRLCFCGMCGTEISHAAMG